MATALLALAACAVAANAAVLAVQWRDLGSIATTVARAVDLAPAMPLVICAYVACGAAGVALSGVGALRRRMGARCRGDADSDPFAAAQRTRIARLAFGAVGTAAALAGCFAVRFAFYALHMTLGV